MNKHKPLNADEEVLPGCDDDGDSTVLVAENERRCVKLALLPPSHTQTTLLASPSSPTSLEPLIYDPTAEGNGDVAMGADANHKQEDGQPESGGGTASQEVTKVYGIRWLMLLLFVMYSMSNAFQWIQYAIITDIIVKYYDVSATAVNWLSMIFMVTYIPLIFPASWYLEKKGLRKAVLIGSFGTMAGAWLKCASLRPDLFYVTFAGQTIVAVSQIFILGIPPRLAAVWFGQDQVSTACAIGVFGNQFGIALGFLLPPTLIPSVDDKDIVGFRLSLMFYTVAIICTILFVAIIFLFREKPLLPPSTAAITHEENLSYMQGIVRLMKNRGYVLLLLSYGMNVGVFYAISTLLNQVVLHHFPGENENAGRIGLLIVLAGMLGSVVSGYALDRSAKFKLVTFLVYFLSLVFMIAYTFIFQLKLLWLVFLMAGMLGFFMTGYLPVGFEFAAELTYPESEGTSSGLLNASAQVFGIFCTMADGELLEKMGDLAANLLLVAVLLVGTIMTACIKEELRRQKAMNKSSADLVVPEPEKIIKEEEKVPPPPEDGRI
ncbi:histamine transporter [Oratosquilla oratoria]|uniref:histamine transporter n=1 Tax=Oratosquilla oratoria TaxID=337810 RepID=UPI003F762022